VQSAILADKSFLALNSKRDIELNSTVFEKSLLQPSQYKSLKNK